MQSKAASGTISEVAFMEALQRKMEATVLTLKSGSYAQIVQVNIPALLSPASLTLVDELFIQVRTYAHTHVC